MSYKTFKEWVILEKRDIFGFQNRDDVDMRHPQAEIPLKQLDSELLIKELWRPIGMKQPSSNFNDGITWGEINMGEAIHLDISPLGSLKIITRRITNDLEGNKTWVCKDIMPLPDGHYDGEETALAIDVFKKVNEINKSPNDSPKREYDLEHLAAKLGGAIKMERPVKIMVFNKIHRLNENHYIISMNVNGHGVEAPGSSRLEQFHIHLFFDKDRGLIRSFGTGIESPTKGHLWSPQPSEFDEHFAPTQKNEEIISAIVNALSTY